MEGKGCYVRRAPTVTITMGLMQCAQKRPCLSSLLLSQFLAYHLNLQKIQYRVASVQVYSRFTVIERDPPSKSSAEPC